MYGAMINIVNAQRAKLNNYYKNAKLKLLKTNAAMWFNKMCKIKQLKPNYISIKINPLNAGLNPICHLLTLFGAHHILLFSR